MKKILTLLFAALIVAASALPALATTPEVFVYDEAELLTETEEAALNGTLNAVNQKHGVQLIVVTADYLWNGISMETFADAVKGTYANTEDCAVFVVCMDLSEYRFQGYGKLYEVYTDDVVYRLEDTCGPKLSDGDFHEAFEAFAKITDEVITLYDAGTPYEMPIPWGSLIFLSLVVGFVIALIVVLILWGQMKSVRRQPAARDYMKRDSLKLTEQRDLFLYTTVSRTARPKSNSSSGGGGSHSRGGGGGGRF